MQEQQERITLRGVVEEIVYQNRDTGYGVLQLDCGGDPITLVGDLADVGVGEELVAYGSFVNHPTYGSQFRCEGCERTLPTSATAIRHYLSSQTVAGVGPATARRLVDAFGSETLEVMAKHPEKLEGIKGISRQKALAIQQELSRIFGLRETVSALAKLGLGTADALQLFRIYGAAAPELIADNPYLLCGFPLYKQFEAADDLAASQDIGQEDPRRLRAGLVNTLRRNLQNGHTCLPTEKLIDITSQFLECSRDAVEIALYDGAESGIFGQLETESGARTFLQESYAAERYIANRLRSLAAAQYGERQNVEQAIDAFEKKNGIIYEPLQREAIAAALESGVVVVTGGPGTGKTTAVNAMLALCEQQGDKVALCAPTGRAAKRMTELTGREAKTIHRMLEVDFTSRELLRFVHNEQNPLKFDVVVVDEMSMVDAALFSSLLQGIRPNCRLILVGDSNQLPSVGAGNVLADIIKSGVCRTVELQKIFRQAAQSLIVVNAHCIVEGNQPDLESRDRDFFFLKCEKEQVPALICDLVARRLPKSYRYDPLEEIQVLSASRLGYGGTGTLNDALRAKLNPPAPNKRELRMGPLFLREGDKVMHIKNNYDIKWTRDNGETGMGMFNGDIGWVVSIDRRTDTISVRFDDRTAAYSFEQARLLEPAYAVTVHKSQGSEFPAVVLAVSDTPRKLCYRNLLYTAVTRAKELLILVGDEKIVAAMVANDRRMLRYNGLCDLLQGAGEET